MVHAIRVRSVVQPGGIVEIQSPDLAAGEAVEVIVLVDTPSSGARSLVSMIGAGKGGFASPEEVDQYIRQERDAWES